MHSQCCRISLPDFILHTETLYLLKNNSSFPLSVTDNHCSTLYVYELEHPGCFFLCRDSWTIILFVAERQLLVTNILKIYPSCGVCGRFFWIIFHCIYTYHVLFSRASNNGRFIFWLLWIMLLQTCILTYLFSTFESFG